MEISILAAGTIWFWIILVVAGIIITYCLEQEEYGGTWSTVICVATLAILYFFGAGRDLSSLLQFIEQNPGTVIAAFFGYIALGVGWSMAKWYFFILRAREKFLEANSRDNRTNYSSSSAEDSIPQAKRYKARILSWMFYWPFSALWTGLNEPVRRIFLNIFRNLEATYDRMSKKIFMNETMRKYEADRLAAIAAREEKNKQEREERDGKKKLYS